MRYLNASEFAQVMPDRDYCDMVDLAYKQFGAERKVTSNPAIATTTARHDTNSILSMKGAVAVSQGVFGVFFGVRSADYYFAVCDSRTGNMLGMVEQAVSVKKRTGASSVVAASYMAKPDSKVAAVIGTGKIATEVVRQLPTRFALDTIRIVSRTVEGARRFVDRVQPGVACPMHVDTSVSEAVANADIVVTITNANTPFIHAGMLKPGSFLCSLGGSHEIDFRVLKEIDRLVVDDIGYALWRGDFAAWVNSGQITLPVLEERIDADIGQVAAGMASGRQGEQRTMAVIQGMAICDLLIAKAALERAAKAGIGTEVPSLLQA